MRDLSDLDGDVNAGGQVELLQLVHGAGGGLNDVEEALVGADLELLADFLSTWGNGSR